MQAGGIRHGAHLDRTLGAIEDELNICAFSPRGAHRLVESVVPQTVAGSRRGTRQVLRSLAAATTSKPQRAASRHLADQRGLIAVGQRIHDAGVARAGGEQRAASASASTFTMMMCLRCSQQASTCPMPAAGEPVAIDDDVNVGLLDEPARVIEVTQRGDR